MLPLRNCVLCLGRLMRMSIHELHVVLIGHVHASHHESRSCCSRIWRVCHSNVVLDEPTDADDGLAAGDFVDGRSYLSHITQCSSGWGIRVEQGKGEVGNFREQAAICGLGGEVRVNGCGVGALRNKHLLRALVYVRPSSLQKYLIFAN